MKLLVLVLASSILVTGCTKNGTKSPANKKREELRQEANKNRKRRFGGTTDAPKPNPDGAKPGATEQPKADPTGKPTVEGTASATPPAGVPSVSQKSDASADSGSGSGEVKTPALPPVVKTNAEETKVGNKPQATSRKEILSGKDSADLLALMEQYLTADFSKMVRTAVTAESRKKDSIGFTLEGNAEKATFKVYTSAEVISEVKNVGLRISGVTRADSTNHKLLSICMGAKCEIIFATIFQREGDKLKENFPAFFKWNGKAYVMAELASDEETKKPQDPSAKVPPQLKVMRAHDQSMDKAQKSFAAVMNTVRRKLVNEDSLYSAQLLSGAKSSSYDLNLKKSTEGFDLKMKIEFNESKKREPIEFSGVLKNTVAKMQSKEGIVLASAAIIPNEFFILIFEKDGYESVLKTGKKANFVLTCQILEEDKVIFSRCEPLSATSVLEHQAIEGKIDGPILVQMKADGTPEILESVSKKN